MYETDNILPSGLRKRTSVTGSILTVETSDPNSDRILKQNELLRNESIVKQKDDLHWSLSFPEFDYHMLLRRKPDLASPDAEISTRAWKKYISSSESKPYRVT